MRSPSCLCVCVSPLSTFQSILMKLGMYIMAPEPNSTAYFINPSHRPCVCMCIPHSVARHRLGEHVPAATKNCWWCRFLCGPYLIKGESVGLCIPLSLLGNNSVKAFPRQRRIVGGVIFYAVRVLSKGESLIRRTSGRSLGTFLQNDALSPPHNKVSLISSRTFHFYLLFYFLSLALSLSLSLSVYPLIVAR
jgi:hypothetical protein